MTCGIILTTCHCHCHVTLSLPHGTMTACGNFFDLKKKNQKNKK